MLRSISNLICGLFYLLIIMSIFLYFLIFLISHISHLTHILALRSQLQNKVHERWKLYESKQIRINESGSKSFELGMDTLLKKFKYVQLQLNAPFN